MVNGLFINNFKWLILFWLLFIGILVGDIIVGNICNIDDIVFSGLFFILLFNFNVLDVENVVVYFFVDCVFV